MQGGVSVQGVGEGLCLGGVSFQGGGEKVSVWRGLCLGGLCLGESLSGGSLFRGGLCLGESLSGGVSVTETPLPCTVTIGWYASYWNAFLLRLQL